MPHQIYFSAREVARATGIHHVTISRKQKAGVFPAFREVCGIKRLHIEDLRAVGIDMALALPSGSEVA
jgi:hypothetical protein